MEKQKRVNIILRFLKNIVIKTINNEKKQLG